MSEEANRSHVIAEPAQILIAPSGRNAGENARCRTDLRRIPADAEAVSIERFRQFLGVKTLADQ
jgi:hypothetical protein